MYLHTFLSFSTRDGTPVSYEPNKLFYSTKPWMRIMPSINNRACNLHVIAVSEICPQFISTHWGPVMYICVSKLIIIGSDNGLLPGRHQAIIWTNAGILFIGPMGTNFNEIVIESYIFSSKKMHLKMPSGKWQPSCLSLNVISHWQMRKTFYKNIFQTYFALGKYHRMLLMINQQWFR